MPAEVMQTLRNGAVGDPVVILQAQLNLGLPDLLPRLNIDGIFGPKTLARTIEFQRRKALLVDGIAGPKTWAKLLAIPTAPLPLARRFEPCGNSLAGNLAQGASLTSSLSFATNSGNRFGVGPTVGDAPAPDTSPVLVEPLTGLRFKRLKGDPNEAKARTVYGDSIDYNRVFLTDVVGQKNRAFVVALPASQFPFGTGISGFVQVVNIGGFSPTDSKLFHELGHVWQSQHHNNPVAYMANCVACQKRAEASNQLAALIDPRVKANDNFPTDFPFSAYGFIPGSGLASYGGEQVAQQIEKGVASIRNHVRGKAPLQHDIDNGRSVEITHLVVQDMRDARATGL